MPPRAHRKSNPFLNGLAMPLLASERPMAEKVDYTVQSGDFLGKLAGKFNTPVALIAKANDIPGAMIRVGETLRVFDGNNHVFALEVSKSRNDLLVTLDGPLFQALCRQHRQARQNPHRHLQNHRQDRPPGLAQARRRHSLRRPGKPARYPLAGPGSARLRHPRHLGA